MTLQTIVAYQAKDGKQFFDLAESQTYSRRQMYGSVYNAALKHDPNFAKLDKEMVIDMLMLFGKHFSTVARDPLAPAPIINAPQGNVAPGSPRVADALERMHSGGYAPGRAGVVVSGGLADDVEDAIRDKEPLFGRLLRATVGGADPILAARNVTRAEEEAVARMERELSI